MLVSSRGRQNESNVYRLVHHNSPVCLDYSLHHILLMLKHFIQNVKEAGIIIQKATENKIHLGLNTERHNMSRIIPRRFFLTITIHFGTVYI